MTASSTGCSSAVLAARIRGALRPLRTAAIGAATLLLAATACVPPPEPTAPDFEVETVASGLTLPTSIALSPDGRMYVGERSGRIWTYDTIGGRARLLVDLADRVTTMYDRSLSGLELDPAFDAGRPYLYAVYSYDAPPGGTHPTWTDDCIFSGFGNDGVCGVTTGQVMRIEIEPDNTASSQHVLLTEWCQQFGGHSVNDAKFGPEGALYVSGGEGANFYEPDSGQFGGNPCGDPPGQGGMLRAQSFRRAAGSPVSLGGSVVRIDPDTGAAWPTNPAAGDPDANRSRIVAYGFRNPYRLDIDQSTGQVGVADVGWGRYEELDLFDPSAGTVPNFGWPCHEGPAVQPVVADAGFEMCESLAPADVELPAFAYSHQDPLGAGCSSGGTSITGIASVRSGTYPAPFDDGMFMGDYSRQCVFFLPRTPTGYDFENRLSIVRNIAAVELEFGPDGNLYMVDILNGLVRRLVPTGTNSRPVASISADPDSGPTPLSVAFSAAGSTDPDGDSLTYAWDLSGDGVFDDAVGPSADWTYQQPGTYDVAVRVTDPGGASDVAGTTVTVGNTRPTASIQLPTPGEYSPGTMVPFAGTGSDPEDGTLPPSAFTWTFTILHCDAPESCHNHDVGTLSGQSSGEFEMPQHARPSWLNIKLTVTDSEGLSHSVVSQVEVGD